MRKIDKIKNEEFYTETLKQWLLNCECYDHDLDCQDVYAFMYDTFHLSWHKTQRIIYKNIPRKILDDLRY